MKRDITNRLEALENRANPEPPRKLVFCDLSDDPGPEEEARRLASAHAEARPNDVIVIERVVEYEKP